MARKNLLAVLAAGAVLLIVTAPASLASTEAPNVTDERPNNGPQEIVRNASAFAKQTLHDTAEALPPPPGSGNGQGGNGNGTGSQSSPPDADNASNEANGVIIRVRQAADDTVEPLADEADDRADGAMASVLGALGALFATAFGIFGRRGANDGGSAGLSDFVVHTAYQNPLLLAGIVATSVGLVALLVWLARRLLPFGIAPLLSRISKGELYENDARRLVADLVAHNPGFSLHEIVERTEYSRNAVSYHLFVLEKEEEITSVKDGKYRRYFPRDGKYVNGAKKVVSVLMNDMSRKIAQYVADHPGTIQREVCEGLGMTPSAACWHAKRLESYGVIRKERDGNMVRYFPGPAVDKYDLADFGLPVSA